MLSVALARPFFTMHSSQMRCRLTTSGFGGGLFTWICVMADGAVYFSRLDCLVHVAMGALGASAAIVGRVCMYLENGRP